jgi:hypothetical protein
MKIYGHAHDGEVRTFEYFMYRVIPGFTRNVDEEFWHILVPRFSHMDQAVWNAVIAMSIFFQQAENGDQAKIVEALTFYQNSLKYLQKQTGRNGEWTATCDLTAIIYICIECLQENAEGARNIYQRVVRVLQVDTKSLSSDGLLVRRAVGSLLRHMALSQGASIPLRQLQSPDISRQLLVSRDSLHELVSEAHQFICSVQEIKIPQEKDWIATEDLVLSRSILQQELHFWVRSVPNIDQTSQHDREIHAVLMLVYHQYHIWLSTCLSMFETAYDDFLESFEAMLNCAQSTISLLQQCVFSFETRVTPSLFFVAIKCRNPQIRRRAISLLEVGPQRENTHDAKQLVKMAQKAVGIEEAGHENGVFLPRSCAEFVPESHRIHRLLNVQGGDDRAACLDIGGWHQQEGQWRRFDYIVKL